MNLHQATWPVERGLIKIYSRNLKTLQANKSISKNGTRTARTFNKTIYRIFLVELTLIF
jgi:hypothetical protein